MDPKKVWSIIFIVLGVLFILGGIGGYHTSALYGNEIEPMGRMIKNYGGKYGGNVQNEFFGLEQAQAIIRREKIGYIFMILLGIAGAIGGT